MLAFVGSVNSLVVEKGILQELPECILTNSTVRDLDHGMLECIAGERPGVAQKREQEERKLRALREILTTLAAFQTRQ